MPDAGEWLAWVLVLGGGYLASRAGASLLARHHGDGWEVLGVLVVGLSVVAGLVWARDASFVALALVALAPAIGLFAGYHGDGGTTA